MGNRGRYHIVYYRTQRHRGDTPRLCPGRLYDVSLRGIGRGVATLRCEVSHVSFAQRTEPWRVAAVPFFFERIDRSARRRGAVLLRTANWGRALTNEKTTPAPNGPKGDRPVGPYVTGSKNETGGAPARR